jgi:histidinol-phosphate aminotransferase
VKPEPRADLLGLAAYVGGASRLEGMAATKLSSNEGAFGPAPGAMRAYREAAADMHRYPDGGSRALREALGRLHGIDPARICCDTGSDPIFSLLALAYGGPGTELVMSEHGFSIYAIAQTKAGGAVVRAPERDLVTDVDAILARVTGRTRLVMVANPNNPTGTVLGASELRRLRAGLPDEVLLVVDAAYAEYVDDPDYEAGAALVSAGENTIMTRTFSKAYGLGGIRLGWAYGPAPVIDVLDRIREPFGVSGAAQAAGLAALAEPGWIERVRAHNTRERARLAAALDELGLLGPPSQANFVLAHFGTPARAAAADAHLRGRGLIVRAVASYGLPAHLRITIGTADDVDAVIAALRDFAGG